MMQLAEQRRRRDERRKATPSLRLSAHPELPDGLTPKKREALILEEAVALSGWTLDELRKGLGEDRTQLAEVRPYVEKLRRADSLQLSEDRVEQSGFEQLMTLERGELRSPEITRE